jgi:3-methylfumaryl-CoA hydratase
VSTEVIAREPAVALDGLLELGSLSNDARTLPPLWHWIYLIERVAQRDLGPDGHAHVGIPAAPGSGYRRMFAGGWVTVLEPLRFGEPATRTARVVGTVERDARSGPLTFVTVRQHIEQGGTLSIVEEQDIVYRPSEGTTQSIGPADSLAPSASQAEFEFNVDPIVLFRFSALTYNAHRIHYDVDYARGEGYPDLVVHGPLQALLMGEAIRRSGHTLVGHQFAYRLVAPAFGRERLSVSTGVGEHDAVTASVRDSAGRITATSFLTDAEVGR